MKPFLILIGGFLVSIGMFVSGVAVAAYFFQSEPAPRPIASVDVSDLWTGEPRTVNTRVQPFERLPPLQSAPAEQSASPQIDASSEASSASVDALATGFLSAPQERSAAGDDNGMAMAAHAQWCADRYRSYDVSADSYTSFSGGQRPCLSPYSRELEDAAEAAPPRFSDETYPDFADEGESYVEFGDEEPAVQEDQPMLRYASGEGNGVAVADSDHVSNCFDRYRSYRPEDNSYQPYGGGPRQQCR